MSVYRIYKEGCDDCYIGSCKDIKERIRHHKTSYNSEKNENLKVYKFIRDNGGWDEWKHEILIQTDIIDNREQLRKMEQDMIDKYKPTLNTNKALSTEEEKRIQRNKNVYNYRVRNKEKVRGKEKDYYYNNREILVEKSKDYYYNNRELIIEKRKEYQKKYRENNRERKKEYNTEKIICEICGDTVSRCHIKRHQRTIKCIKFKN